MPKSLDYDKLEEIMESNMKPGDIVTTEMMWNLCKHMACYNIVSRTFKDIRQNLISQGRLEQITPREYRVLKNKWI